ncbi:MAG: DEAD/DEAH box helicase [Verrucomicrobia bacterium]|nr:DEAD/DEAH box helicase [Verrucomicrobiota bacterium]
MSPTPDTAPSDDAHADRRLRDALGDVGRAFFDFPSLLAVQRAAIPPIARGENILVCAPTASGKTESVVAPLVWRLRQRPTSGTAGPRLLAVAPTRALVADLVARLEQPLARIGWRCGAQTSDFAGADSTPDVLVTTPESFDSMLVRRVHRKEGELVGHLLASVGAVFVDEAHCFDSTARGDQVVFLLTRLRKLRESGLARGWIREATIQVCAASATISEPDVLAERLLGTGARAVLCPGARPIEILTKDQCWLRLDQSLSPRAVTDLLPNVSAPAELGEVLWRALESGECRKALVFVPSRSECDRLGRDLRRLLNKRRAIWVDSHHGSLSREHRRRAEREFHQYRDAVLVATNTLEVGVDIGDVDVVALVGAPPDTSGLLQRIGRGGRRSGVTRLLPLPRNRVEAAALASQMVCAVGVQLEPKVRFRRWDVFPQ